MAYSNAVMALLAHLDAVREDDPRKVFRKRHRRSDRSDNPERLRFPCQKGSELTSSLPVQRRESNVSKLMQGCGQEFHFFQRRNARSLMTSVFGSVMLTSLFGVI
jgi:hypothetical protein